MDNDSVIFSETDTSLLKRYGKRILTARVLLFGFAAISFLAAIIGIYFGIGHRAESNFFIEGLVLGCTGVIFLVLAIICIWRPFISFSIVAVLIAICLILVVPDMLRTSGIVDNIIFILLQCSFIYFLVRGAIYAAKYKKLRNRIDGSNF